MSIFYCTIFITIILLLIYFFGVPLLIYLAPFVLHHLFFLHLVRNPFTNYKKLNSFGVKSIGRNFYLEVKSPKYSTSNVIVGSAFIGVWHILPKESSKLISEMSNVDNSLIENMLHKDRHSIIIYLHGNTFDRTTSHRCKLYNKLSEMNFHVFAIDYRGFGDSKGLPSEDGLVLDSLTIYQYVRERTSLKKIFLWGHSMGTGIATRLASELSISNKAPDALILESPFNNIRDVIIGHPFSYPLRLWPRTLRFDELIIKPLISSGLKMNSDEQIKSVKCPILILHAADDHIISIQLALKLKEAAEKANRNIKFIEFPANRQLKHKYIYKAEELNQILDNFMEKNSLKI